MLLPAQFFLPTETLIQVIFNKYLIHSYCLTFVSEHPLTFSMNVSFLYVVPKATENLVDQLLEASEMGCSDYIIHLQDPQIFMPAFEKVNHIGNVRRSDRKLIFVPIMYNEKTKNDLLEVLEFEKTKFIANVLLILPSNESKCISFDLVTHKFTGPSDDINCPVYLDRWNSCSAKFDKNVDLFPYDMSNLLGKTIKVASFTYKPYSLLDLDPTVAPNGRDGTEIRIVDEFCRWVNCTIELVRDDEHEWGEIYENLTGVGVLGNVVEDRADFGISALYSWYEEYLVLDFSVAGIKSSITCVAPSPKLLASWEMPLQPFHWLMWVAVLITFIYASVGLMIAQRCSTDRVFLTTFGMMITQSQNDAGSTWRIRSITGWLLVTGLVLDNAYSGGLASVFTIPKYEKSIDTVQDIVDRRMEWAATHDAWVFSLTLSSEPLVKQLVQQFRVESAEDLKRKSQEGKIAFSIEKLPAGYFAVGDYITKEAMSDLTLMLEDFYFEQCVVMLRKSSPYTEKISQFIGRLHEAGLLLAWETQVALKYLNYEVQLEVRLSRSRKDVYKVEPLGLRNVVGIFILYLIGVTISVILFVVEVLVNRRKKTVV